MVWFIIFLAVAIIFFAILIGVINSVSKSTKNINPGFLPPSQAFEPLNSSETTASPKKHFFDREHNFDDMSYLTPSEASREFNERKRDGEYLDFDEYGGYMNVIHSGKDDNRISRIDAMTPEQLFKWYLKFKDEGKWTTPAVFDAVASKLKPFHEQILLDAMNSVTQGRIDGWVNARKKEGYFFSENAYEKAEKIFTGEIDNRKKKARKQKQVADP
jgi:hypothetical protein